MNDEQIQANADRAHADSVAMTDAINAQTEQMKAATAAVLSQVAVQEKMLAAYSEPAEPAETRLSFADMTALTGVLAELLKSTKA